MDLHLGKTTKALIPQSRWWAATCTYTVLLSTLAGVDQIEAFANPLPPPPPPTNIDLLLDDFQLGAFGRTEGPKFEIDLPDGMRCQTTQGTPPTISFFGGASRRDDEYRGSSFSSESQSSKAFNFGHGYSVGTIVSVPLASMTRRNCDEAYELHLVIKKLELATLLFEQGLIPEDSLKGLTHKAKLILNK